MAWSAAGSVATYPSQLVTQATTTDGTFTLNLTFRADVAAAVVYVIGTWTAASNTQTFRNMNAVPLVAPFRPIVAASLVAANTTSSGGTATLQITPQGGLQMTAFPTTAGWSCQLRHFYFTDVSPA